MKKLTVLECNYLYNQWRINVKEDKSKVISEIKEFIQRRAVDDYQLCGLYHKAGVPFEVEEINRNAYPKEEPYIAVPKAFSDACCEGIKQGNGILVSSGYCVYAPAIVGGIQRAIGKDKKIGIVWIDAHGDNVIIDNTNNDVVTLVGVPLSTSIGQTMDEWRINACGLEIPCDSENVIVSDARCIDEECKHNLLKTNAKLLNTEEFNNFLLWENEINNLASKVDALYLMVDIDILEGKYIPAYYEPEPGGNDVSTVMKNVKVVMNTNKVIAFSCFCVDFDKFDQGGDTTYLNAMRIIAAGLENWKVTPEF